MPDSNAKSPNAAAKPAQAAAKAPQPKTGGGASVGSVYVQRAVEGVGGRSPQTPPASFSALLGELAGSPAARSGLLLHLQRGHGNAYVNRVVRDVPPQGDSGVQASVQRDAAAKGDAGARGGAELTQDIRAASARGDKLETGMRGVLERSLGADLSAVRVHTDETADRLARTVGARAFTTGRDIFFREGEYQPGTHEGGRLLAHEAAHAVQQAAGPVEGTPAPGGVRVSDPSDAYERAAAAFAESFDAQAFGGGAGLHAGEGFAHADAAPSSATFVQRQETGQNEAGGQTHPTAPASVVAPAQKESSAATPPDDELLWFDETVLSTSPSQVRRALEEIAKKKGIKGVEAFRNDFESDRENKYAPRTRVNDNAPPGLADRVLNVVITEADALSLYADRLAITYRVAAYAHANEMLDQSQKIIEEEALRYGVPLEGFEDEEKIETRAAPSEDSEASGLAEAAKVLLGLYSEMMRLRLEENRLEPTEKDRYTGEGYTDAAVAERERVRKQTIEAQFKYDVARAGYEGEYPILAAYSEENIAGLQTLAESPEPTATLLAPLVADKLDNIKEVREGLDKLIWKEETIVKGTRAVIGIEADSLAAKLLDERAEKEESEAMLLTLALTVFAVALGLLAAIPTAGASLGVVVASAAAAAGGLVLTGIQLGRSIQQYQLENAAKGTSFDKAKAISQEDPSLFWLALDIVGAVVDVFGAYRVFKAAAPLIRAAQMVRKGEAAARAAGMGLKELEALRDLTKGHPGLYERIVSHFGSAADASKVPLDQLEKAARTQYKSLSESGRLAEIGDVGEELFVKQMLSGAQQHVIVSGVSQGAKRATIITSLLDPSNPILKGVIAGDVKQMDALLIQHGNWKQLISMLEQGTPEMRKAAGALLNRRRAIEAEVEKRFKAMLTGKPSTLPVSDVDRAAEWGKQMIEAENWVKSRYGPGWSEALRMNFYSQASRLTVYQDVLGALSPAQQAKLLGKLTEKTEIHTIAKMLHHAGDNPARLAEVEAMAKRLGVKLDSEEVQGLLPLMSKGAGNFDRDQALMEVDFLMRRYRAAKPGSEEQLKLAQEITERQMRANLLTEEAYLAPGALRMIASGAKVVGHEAYQAALGNIEMVAHAVSSNGGNIVATMRQYEVYKYMNRFAEAAGMAGSKNPSLSRWKTLSGGVYKDRKALEDVSHLRHRGRTSPIDPDVTGPELEKLYAAWQSFSQQVLAELKAKALANPSAWTP